MITYKDYLEAQNLDKFRDYSRCNNPSIIKSLLQNLKPGPETFALLCSPAASGFLEDMAAKSAALTAQRLSLIHI